MSVTGLDIARSSPSKIYTPRTLQNQWTVVGNVASGGNCAFGAKISRDFRADASVASGRKARGRPSAGLAKKLSVPAESARLSRLKLGLRGLRPRTPSVLPTCQLQFDFGSIPMSVTGLDLAPSSPSKIYPRTLEESRTAVGNAMLDVSAPSARKFSKNAQI